VPTQSFEKKSQFYKRKEKDVNIEKSKSVLELLVYLEYPRAISRNRRKCNFLSIFPACPSFQQKIA
jgi:hypothetical protein